MILLMVHAAVTLIMTGVIWFVQIVHYPLFDQGDRADFGRFADRHATRTAWVVGPPMLAEAATALWLVMRSPPGVDVGLAWIGLALLAVIWSSTALLQVPAHRRLALAYDPEAHRSLVRWNWVRTLTWTARSAIAVWIWLEAARIPMLVLH